MALPAEPERPQIGHHVGILRPRRRHAVGRAERGDPGAVVGRILAGEQGQVAGPLRHGHLREGAGMDLADQGPAQGLVAQGRSAAIALFRSSPDFPRGFRFLGQDCVP